MFGDGATVHLLAWLSRQPFILLFLVVAAGIALGRVKIKGIGLGATASSLVIALGVSVLASGRGAKIAVPELASTIFFNVFMFSVGHEGGPAVPRRAQARRRQVHLLRPLHAASRATGSCWRCARSCSSRRACCPGSSRAATPPRRGSGRRRRRTRRRTRANQAETLANLSTAFAFSYCLSTVLFVLFAKLPDIFGRDTARAAREFEARLRGSSSAPLPGTADEFLGGPLPVARRSYQIEKPRAGGPPPGRAAPHLPAGRDRARAARADSSSTPATTSCCSRTTRSRSTAACRGC